MGPQGSLNFDTIESMYESCWYNNTISCSRPKTKEDMLYEVPQHIDVKSKIMKSEEMLSSQMLSGIPEVNLGIEAKMRNIEATEEARQKVQQEMSQKRSEPTVMVPTNMATNFLLHNRCKFLNPL